jgi:hypothetical protein
MADSLSFINNIDLNAAPTTQHIVMPNIQLDVPDVHPEVPVIHPNIPAIPLNVWQPNFTSKNRPITIHDSVMLHDSTAVAMARGFATPRDQTLLADRSDSDAINNSLAYIIQGVVSTSDLTRRLYVRNEEMKILRNQIGVL